MWEKNTAVHIGETHGSTCGRSAMRVVCGLFSHLYRFDGRHSVHLNHARRRFWRRTNIERENVVRKRRRHERPLDEIGAVRMRPEDGAMILVDRTQKDAHVVLGGVNMGRVFVRETCVSPESSASSRSR